MSRKSIAPGRQPTYRTQLFPERVQDSYKSGKKLPSPTLCPECSAVFSDGRWTWQEQPNASHRELCPACHRIHDRLPSGYVRLEGEFLLEHRGEMLDLIRNIEAREKAAHPLKRVMDIVDEDGGVLVTTTDIHLAHGIGEALHRAYKGSLDLHYSPDEILLRVRWSR